MLYGSFNNRLIVSGEIITLRPMSIGHGSEQLDPTAVDNGVVKDAKGNPVIPASSLKGVLRSSLEMMLSGVEGYTVCNILDKKDPSCTRDSDMKNLKKLELSERETAEKIYKKNCDICKLFGGYYFAGKLQIKDMHYLGDLCRFEYRDGVGINRDTGTAQHGAKYDYEIVPADQKFDFYMVADNLEDSQKKLVEIILDMLQLGEINIGGKVSRGLGQIKLCIIENHFIENVGKLREYYEKRLEGSDVKKIFQ